MKNLTLKEELEIYNYCEERWSYYEIKDNGYFPSRHDNVVLKEAGEKFSMPSEDINTIFQKVSKEKADAQFKKMTQEQLMSEIEKVLRSNKETPWGQGLDKK